MLGTSTTVSLRADGLLWLRAHWITELIVLVLTPKGNYWLCEYHLRPELLKTSDMHFLEHRTWHSP